MNLKWKKILGILTPTDRFEKSETSFMAASTVFSDTHLPEKIREYKKLSLECKFAAQHQQKLLRSRLNELSNDPEVAFYIRQSKGKKTPVQDFQLTFREEFNSTSGNTAFWKPGFYYPDERLKKHHGFANEQQWNNAGRNTFFRNDAMQIFTRRENAEGLAWHPQKGFILKKFDYTADVVHSAETFHQRGGLFRAKIRCSGFGHHAFWLGNGKKQPHINIFHCFGNEIQVGFLNKDDGEAVNIIGIDPSVYHIYSLEWTHNQLVWSINNIEVLRCRHNIPWESMHMVFNSFIPEKDYPGEGLLEVDWVRVYQHKL